METTTSKSGSLKGYKFNIWLKKNKDTIKNLASGAMGLLTFIVAPIQNPALAAGAGVVTATLTKLVVDGIDFWISDVEIKEDSTNDPGQQ